ncbi:inositol monophosphatase family protein [Phaeobacter gallaeciensis]|uniref:inositol monophosphatase family protein n=1 Tax=Phaeobacter gallaeciensis TaxID=60890 RepID=UPI00237FA810|nr:inositol monophosphatase family protein [Phaeobacter gallaeciensis]MDE4193110.1 hypothetical protein [Phaeobacter gallaeciensis]MDE4201449.1 hypothetical protein [Phaeobacter gallaeciensis]MDE4205629.1 hypothetical protein [Phaeobacter gallaeciensis]MDE4209745.1 hypothetical protein [Phaeobacter gallaeciensis]MDE4218155.1 hypothetical protein [Phaeobacter gallaeciensis]
MTDVLYLGEDLTMLVDMIGAAMRRIVSEEIARAGIVVGKVNDVAGDVVTEADFRIQARLFERLTELVPESLVIGEEGFEAVDAIGATPAWIVDPLDGTLNFACNLPFYGSSVGLFLHGTPLLGVVFDAGSGTVWDATHDGPARRDGVIFRHDSEISMRAPIGISSGFLAKMRAEPERFARPWLGERFRIFGSQAIQLCWAAEGRLRFNVNPEAKLWDDAAGALICTRACAGHAALADDPFYPLQPGGAALSGRSIFSVSGSPDLVEQARDDFNINE